MTSVEPGWYGDPRNPDFALWWDGQVWKDVERPIPARRIWIVHFLLFAIALVVLGLACEFLVGIIAIPFALRTTGRRARDTLMLVIPVWGAVVVIQTVWRLTDSYVNWCPRYDRRSRPLFGPGVAPKAVFPAVVRPLLEQPPRWPTAPDPTS